MSALDPNGPRWYQLNAAQWVTVALVAVSALASYNQFEHRISTNDKSIIAVEKRLTDIDNAGTSASRMTLQRDHQMITSMDQRLQKLEDVSVKIQLLSQVVDTIKLDVKDVKSDLKEVKERPNDYKQLNSLP